MTKSILERLKKEPTPLIDPDGVTFVWKGKTAPRLKGDFTGWDEGVPVKLEKLEKGLWAYQLEFPADAYIEYSFVDGDENLIDPSNPRRTSNGVGGFNNFFGMPNYKPTDLARKNRRIPHGTVNSYTLPTDYLLMGDERSVFLYQPPVTERVPLVIVWDGYEYLKRTRLNYMVDNLVTRGKMRPVALAFVSNGGEESRTAEYACNEATLAYLLVEVIPLARKELNLVDLDSHPGAYGVVGSSMGGLMALYTAARLPEIFGNVLSQSGAFSLGSLDTVVFDLFEQRIKHPLNIWLDVGKYDLPGLLETNRRMQSLLIRQGYSLSYREYNSGHNWPAWRDELWRGLEVVYSAQG